MAKQQLIFFSRKTRFYDRRVVIYEILIMHHGNFQFQFWLAVHPVFKASFYYRVIGNVNLLHTLDISFRANPKKFTFKLSIRIVCDLIGRKCQRTSDILYRKLYSRFQQDVNMLRLLSPLETRYLLRSSWIDELWNYNNSHVDPIPIIDVSANGSALICIVSLRPINWRFLFLKKSRIGSEYNCMFTLCIISDISVCPLHLCRTFRIGSTD